MNIQEVPNSINMKALIITARKDSTKPRKTSGVRHFNMEVKCVTAEVTGAVIAQSV
jgi:hypothetical protein